MVKIRKQKVRAHRKKGNSSRIKPGHLKIIFKFILMALALGVIGIGLERLKYMFVDSDYFIIKAVDIKFYNEDGVLRNVPLDDVTDGNIVGKNIFLMDLNDLKEKIEIAHPEFKDIVIKRALPNRLTMQAKKRKPVLQLRSDRFYFVDGDGIILPNIKNFPEEGLPVVSGINITAARIKSGLAVSQRQVIDKSLILLKSMSANKKLSKYRLKMVDVADSHNISFFLNESNVEIKIGESEFNKRLDVLATVLEQLSSDISRVKYIDLRFEDPIVGPR